LALLAALASGCSDRADGATGGSGDSEWYEARVQSFDLTIVESGQLEAARKVEIKSKVNGRPAIIEVVDEGINVEAGELLVLLDSAAIEEELAEEQLQLETTRADKVSAEQGLAIAISEAAADQRAAEVALRLAELELAEWEQGEVPTQKRTLNLALDKAQREVERAKRNYATDQELFAQRFISQDELEDSEIDTIEAEDALAPATLDIEVYNSFTFLKEQQEFQSAVDQARAELQQVKAENESKLSQARAKAEAERRGLELQEMEVAEEEAQLAATRIVAPQAGMVVYASSSGGRRYRGDPIAEGREVRNNETILILPDTSQLVAVLSVPEALAPQVQPGQPVQVTVDAIPDRVFEAEVESVSVLAEDGGWWNNNVKNFTVRALLKPRAGDGQLKPTMTATGTIFTGRVENAVAVPVQAIFAEGPQRFVYVSAGLGGGVVRQDVEIGRASETLVEITSGLDAGTAVLLRAPRPGEEVQG
jgi:HlyD family secretion protein